MSGTSAIAMQAVIGSLGRPRIYPAAAGKDRGQGYESNRAHGIQRHILELPRPVRHEALVPFVKGGDE